MDKQEQLLQEQLLTVKDLSIKWKKDEGTIRKQITEGILQPCNVPGSYRFKKEYVAQLEGVKLERFSPLERRRLLKEIELLKKKNQELESLLRKLTLLGVESMNLLSQDV